MSDETPKKPRTEKQIAASRENGKKSKGPITTRGKAISSRNGLRYGLYASAVIKGVESRGQFRKLMLELQDYYHPVGPMESYLVEEIGTAIWEVRRGRKQETLDWTEFCSGSGDYPPDHSDKQEKARTALYRALQRLEVERSKRETRGRDQSNSDNPIRKPNKEYGPQDEGDVDDTERERHLPRPEL